MQMSSRSSRLLALAAASGLAMVASAHARGTPRDTVLTAEQIQSLDRQLEAPDTSSGLWEEYERYRDRDREDLHASGERVKVGDSVTVDEDELVRGDVVSIGGDVIVKGVVDGDVVAVGGDVVLHEGAEIQGDAVSVGGRVRELGPASVRGEKVSVNVPIPLWGLRAREVPMAAARAVAVGWKIGFLAVGLLLVLLFNAVAERRLDVVSRRVEAEPGQSFLLGLLGAFGTPIAMLIAFLLLAITIVGLLLFPVLVILIALLMLGGFAAVSIAIGRRIGQGRDAAAGSLQPARSSYWNLAVGYVALQALPIVSMIFGVIAWGPFRPLGILCGVLGAFVLAFASILGYGAVLTSRIGTQPPGAPIWPARSTPPPPPLAPSGAAPTGSGPTPPAPPAPLTPPTPWTPPSPGSAPPGSAPPAPGASSGPSGAPPGP